LGRWGVVSGEDDGGVVGEGGEPAWIGGEAADEGEGLMVGDDPGEAEGGVCGFEGGGFGGGWFDDGAVGVEEGAGGSAVEVDGEAA
jgi:hypothetical protein